ncbi:MULTISPECIES: hypothetical protein [Pseudomonas aeruginosa group]|uniref:Uncharacterized protein n=1 Tax=Pseudomonas paraeruginosa TaxID=2994495 RepID=A0A2R3IVR1_9PSED|nr:MULTISPECIES: hypothetical protein [Pseudomonas aeruginosa group]AVK05990.1 hypothetical protein CSB93_1046 [Pseudomonas paraeruginosa]AWE91384.1 hypothetical protein CSC28_6362 [Pseudomonas paraeruginosa]MCW8030738.1 hypothetical protein [Pseudomonas aeruginosa]MCW8032131.1 hypothetical protein [Pseudomonas aeruginosa]MDY1577551.1 hypothetical protein [Pseudomonas paraeruginosa]
MDSAESRIKTGLHWIGQKMIGARGKNWIARKGRGFSPCCEYFFLIFPKESVKPCGKVVRSRLEGPYGGAPGGLIVK